MYTEKTFSIPTLTGMSQQSIDEHLKLYAGYVKNTNMILEAIQSGSHEGLAPSGAEGYALAEMQRRFSFEFNGMKNHEYYFQSLEGGATELSDDSSLKQKIAEQWGSSDIWMDRIKTIAKTRGVGWAILYYDRDAKMLVNGWVDEQHLGHLNSCQYIVGIDMWEHAFVADYQPSGKGQYVEDYFANINWSVVSDLYDRTSN